ncbi:MAG TPA: hypothetical protein VE692_03290 [Nitrososphaera sp.]|nr:hypothetical protein [Nitrososphaera sp.]
MVVGTDVIPYSFILLLISSVNVVYVIDHLIAALTFANLNVVNDMLA